MSKKKKKTGLKSFEEENTCKIQNHLWFYFYLIVLICIEPDISVNELKKNQKSELPDFLTEINDMFGLRKHIFSFVSQVSC